MTLVAPPPNYDCGAPGCAGHPSKHLRCDTSHSSELTAMLRQEAETMSNNEAPERIYLTADSVHKSIAIVLHFYSANSFHLVVDTVT